MAEEIFIALENTSQEIKTAVEDVRSDVNTMQTDVTEVKGNVSTLKSTDVPNIDALVDAVLERIGLTTDTGGSASLGTLMAKMNAVLNKLDSGSGGGEKWVYSGKTGTEKILINNEEWLEEELELPAETDDYDNNAYIVGFFVPKVSGIHTITVEADTLNSNDDAILCFATYNELMQAVTNYNIIESAQIEAIDDLFERFNAWDGEYSSRGIDKGKDLMRNYMTYRNFASESAYIIRYCTKDEPVFLLAANNETTDITLWSAVVTVKYRETEAYE